ncbi:MAG: alkaline phosphatase family protein [Bacteroidales bacterium]
MNRLLTSLIVVLAAANLNAQQMSELPKLVVGITVDQLRSDYLHFLYNAFGEKGFKRLMREGALYEHVDFDFDNPDRASAMATIFTGAYPYYNGIIANSIFNPANLRVESAFHDPRFMGNYTTQTVSPARILSSTLTDELKVASGGLSQVFAIAPNMEQALIGAGHAANGAFWIDDVNGKWATTTFFKEVPWYVERYNRTQALDNTIESAQWEPLLPVSAYKFIPYMSADWSFKHNFGRVKKDRFRNFKTSALVNDEINKMVSQFLNNGALGKKNNPDFLSITYNAGGYADGSDQEYSLETQDTYLRLDQNIGALLDMIEKTVGLNNTFIFLTSSGNFNTEVKAGSNYKVPTGEFHPKRCAALLNTYLMALYGQENWVTGYHNQQIYLNRKMIEDKKVDLKEIQVKAAEFVIQFAGIQDVVTSHQMLHGNWNKQINKYRNGFHRKLSGDLILSIQPGWEIIYEDINFKNTTVRKDGIPAPLILFGPQVKAERISRVIDATEIAPSVSRILRIRSPNACNALPLPEIR